MEVKACLRTIRVSRQKLNLVAKVIRRKPVAEAFRVLLGVRKRAASYVYKALKSGVANAENNFMLDVDRLYVREATVGRDFVLKRSLPCGRSRTGRVEKEFSSLYIVLGIFDEEVSQEKTGRRSKPASLGRALGKVVVADKSSGSTQESNDATDSQESASQSRPSHGNGGDSAEKSPTKDGHAFVHGDQSSGAVGQGPVEKGGE